MVGPRIVRVKSPFDWVLSSRGRSAVLDTKSTEQATFVHSHIDQWQVAELIKHHRCGVAAGYVIWFKKPDQVVFINAKDLLLRSMNPGSIRSDSQDVLPLGQLKDMKFELIFKQQG